VGYFSITGSGDGKTDYSTGWAALAFNLPIFT